MVNIFFTDWDPIVAARDTCDNYVVKIPIEVGLLLSAIHWRTGYDGPVASGQPLVFDAQHNVMHASGPYRNSNNIKSTSETYRWLVKSTGNYMYAVTYGLEMISEFKRRYGTMHKTEGVLLWLSVNLPDISGGPLTRDVGLAMPDEYKDRNNPTSSYKRYILSVKSNIVSWKRSVIPEWARRFVYTDGAASGNGTQKCKATYAVWFDDSDPRNVYGTVHDEPSNQIAELTAVKKALETVRDSNQSWTVVTDSQYSIDCLTDWVHTWKCNGWRTSNNKPVKHKHTIQDAVGMLDNHTLLHVHSHSRQPANIDSIGWKHWYGNMQADALAKNALSLGEFQWHPHPDDGNYKYTVDITLDTGFPVISPFGYLVATVDDDNVNGLTEVDVTFAKAHGFTTNPQLSLRPSNEASWSPIV